ncbi:hypothetical protein AKJ16_DCAP23156 [Drosera capensis]
MVKVPKRKGTGENGNPYAQNGGKRRIRCGVLQDHAWQFQQDASSAAGIHSRYWNANMRCARSDSEESRRRILEGEDGENCEMLLLFFVGMDGRSFVLCQGLELQDFVVFRLIGDRVFEFLTFDKSSCQKGLPWTSSAAGHDEGSETC